MKKAAHDFIAQDPRSFYRAFIKTHAKYDVIVNNPDKTFNACIVQARAKHLVFMLEDIRTALT